MSFLVPMNKNNSLNNPFNAIETIFDRLFDDDVYQPFSSRGYGWQSPQAKISDSENGYNITLPIPGAKKENIDVSVKNKQLIISCKGESEYWSQQFTKSWTLSDDTDINKISASYEDGILQIEIPKKPERVKQIKIK